MRASDKKLSMALREAGLEDMAKLAAAGHYNEFFGPLDTPMLTLLGELQAVGTPKAQALRKLVMDGDFDAGSEEAEEWAQSDAGEAAFDRLIDKS